MRAADAIRRPEMALHVEQHSRRRPCDGRLRPPSRAPVLIARAPLGGA